MVGPRIAVVTPYCGEPVDMLRQCHESVLAQGVGADHLMVADGDQRGAVAAWDVQHVVLPRAHGDNGNTPRGIGSLLARSEGYDFVAYLDADNWYHAGHLRSLLDLWERNRAPVCTSLRTFHDAAGKDLGVTERDEDALRHVDTSCLLIHRAAFDCLSLWLDMPKVLAPVCDRVFLAGLLHRKLTIASTGARTVAFRTRYRVHYEAAGLPAPVDAKDADALSPAAAFLASSEGVGQCVGAMGFWPPSYVSI